SVPTEGGTAGESGEGGAGGAPEPTLADYIDITCNKLGDDCNSECDASFEVFTTLCEGDAELTFALFECFAGEPASDFECNEDDQIGLQTDACGDQIEALFETCGNG
ncbi:MAG: hypothetical protein M3020_23730, partial [Myxococcota bacterium]|nr:hypothetical protein [Myxococcota bacterium]